MKPIKCECGKVLIPKEGFKITTINKAVVDFLYTSGKIIIDCGRCNRKSVILLDARHSVVI